MTLEDQAGRLFKPLAVSKTVTMVLAAFLAVTLDPALRMIFTRLDEFRFNPPFLRRVANLFLVGKYQAEEEHPVSRRLFKIYEPVCRWALENRRTVFALAAGLFFSSIPLFWKLGSEFMPPFNEGALLYMPTALPGMSVTEAQRVLTLQDGILKSFPEVESVFGKAGRVDSPTDPAPFSMVETTVILKPESQWREVPRWYSSWPGPFRAFFGLFKPGRMTLEELRSEMDSRLQIPGIPNI